MAKYMSVLKNTQSHITEPEVHTPDSTGYYNFGKFPTIQEIIPTVVDLISTGRLKSPRFLTRFNADNLGERKKWIWQREQWRLTYPIVYVSNIPRKYTIYVVPTNFVTDCASVPMLPLTYMLFGHIGRRASATHDMLYRWGTLQRLISDDVFYEGLRAVDTLWVKAQVMHKVVMSVGWFAYKPWLGCLDYYKCKGPKRSIVPCNSCEKFFKGITGTGSIVPGVVKYPAAGFYYV